MSDCIFCKIIAGDIPAIKIHEDETCIAFLDIHPVNPGHALIVPREHHMNFLETPRELVAAIMELGQKLAPAILKAVGSDSFNFSTNNGRAAGQLIAHTHFHLIPRFPADGHKMWHGSDEHQDFAAMAVKIRAAL